MRRYDRKAPLVSLHVPKTAGTSLRSTLGQWFPDGRLLLHYRDHASGAPPVKHRFKGPICIHGHFNANSTMGVDAYYPQAEQFIVFLRDPFERFVSLYFHFAKAAASDANSAPEGLAHDPSFERFLKDFAAEHAAGGGVAYQQYFPHAPDVAAIKRAMAECFVFVGVTERNSASLVALGRALGKPEISETFENRIERFGPDLGCWRPFHETAFPEDHEIYATALDLNAEQIAHLR